MPKNLKKAINRLDTKNKILVHDIIDMLDRHNRIFYIEKYGFIRILTGYDFKRRVFRYIEAPLHYCTSEWQTLFHITKHRMLTEYEKNFEEIEYFSWEIKPLSKLQNWFLSKIKGVK